MIYNFVTEWRFNAPVEQVWKEIYYSEHWPEWWKGVVAVEALRTGGTKGIGDMKRYTWRSALPYSLSFDMTLTENEPLHRLVGLASGELDGTGIWTFSSYENTTFVRYDWQVRTTKKWMNFLAPIARPFFSWNHDVVMEWGRKALEKRLAK